MRFPDEEDRRIYAEQEVAKAAALLDVDRYVEADETLRHCVHSGATAVDVFHAIGRLAVHKAKGLDP